MCVFMCVCVFVCVCVCVVYAFVCVGSIGVYCSCVCVCICVGVSILFFFSGENGNVLQINVDTAPTQQTCAEVTHARKEKKTFFYWPATDKHQCEEINRPSFLTLCNL